MRRLIIVETYFSELDSLVSWTQTGVLMWERGWKRLYRVSYIKNVGFLAPDFQPPVFGTQAGCGKHITTPVTRCVTQWADWMCVSTELQVLLVRCGISVWHRVITPLQLSTPIRVTWHSNPCHCIDSLAIECGCYNSHLQESRVFLTRRSLQSPVIIIYLPSSPICFNVSAEADGISRLLHHKWHLALLWPPCLMPFVSHWLGKRVFFVCFF